MKKSTVLVIFIIYLVSIVAIGFFGMAVKIEDGIKYVEAIEMSIRADDESMYSFKENGTTPQGNKKYELTIHFSKAVPIQYERDDGITEIRDCILITFIPNVTYDTGDTANAEEESIVYSLSESNKVYQEKDYISLNERGELMCFRKNIDFRIYVDPESKGSYQAGIIIDVYVEP